jgi:hypothetical protein
MALLGLLSASSPAILAVSRSHSSMPATRRFASVVIAAESLATRPDLLYFLDVRYYRAVQLLLQFRTVPCECRQFVFPAAQAFSIPAKLLPIGC